MKPWHLAFCRIPAHLIKWNTLGKVGNYEIHYTFFLGIVCNILAFHKKK